MHMHMSHVTCHMHMHVCTHVHAHAHAHVHVTCCTCAYVTCCVWDGVRCQVLMAGAMRPDSAGLKSISAKHLALSSQSLGMFLTLMPHIKAVLAAYVPEAQRSLRKEMDSATADYEEHQQQLFSK